MSDGALDPYEVLGVAQSASDAELRRAYRELVMRHHPDHNGGSAESAARFERIQSAYAVISHRRLQAAGDQRKQGAADPDVEARIQDLERELASVREAQHQRARTQARAASPQPASPQPSTPEELGQYTTEDSFTSIIDDAAEQLAQRLRDSEATRQLGRRISGLFGRGK